MSIKDRLSKKTEGLVVPSRTTGTAAGNLRTGPGQMLMVNSLMKESNQKLALLEERLKQYEGVLPVKLIAPEKIKASKWANRNACSFEAPEFATLKAEIAASEGNVQPIKVRPVTVNDDSQKEEQFEIVFGHRRHRACLELAIPVLALVEEVTDVDLFKEMDRENRARLDLSPWEQGMMYRRALDEKLFPTQEQLARELGVDPGNLSKALKLASLDERIVEAFPSPLDLQYRWAKPLLEAQKGDAAGLLERARQLKAEKRGLSPRQIFDALVGTPAKPIAAMSVVVDGLTKALISRSGDNVSIRFSEGIMSEDRLKELQELLSDWLQP